MAKFTVETKMQAAQDYLNGSGSQKEIARRYGVNQQVFRQWIDLYRHHGEARLRKRYTNYTAEFKLDVLYFMNDTGASPSKAAAVFNIPARTPLLKWKEAVKCRGIDALIPKKKGRPSMNKQNQKSVHSKQPNESLQEEVERLRMENAYLKKLNALVKEKEASQRNSKRK